MQDFFDWFNEYVLTAFWETTIELWVWVTFHLMVGYYKTAIYAAEFAGSYLIEMLLEINNITIIQTLYAQIPDDAVAILSMLQIPAALSVIFGAYAVALGLRLVWRR